MYQNKLHTYSKGNGKKRTNRHTKESQALRDIRILKRISREEIARLIGKSKEMVKKYEDGRCNYDVEAQSIMLRRFRYNRAEFNQLLNGEIKIPKLSARTVHRPIMKQSRKRKQVETKEAKILKILRKRAKLTQEQAAKLSGLSRNMIDHRESGRVNLNDRAKEIKHIVKSYGLPLEEYYELLDSEILRDVVIEECIAILETISDDKLRAVQALLLNFK